jgi:hypothetical protein
MAMYYAYANIDGSRNSATDTLLSPRPTRVRSPQEPTGTVIPVAAGSVVVQQPLTDNRVRSWVWEGYPDWLPSYQPLWDTLQSFRSRYRAQAGLSPYVYLRDDESRTLRQVAVSGAGVVSVTYPWVRVRVIEVSRRIREGQSSLVVWEETAMKWVIEDAAFNDFG